jgi:tRNA A-37 threonylcarbamoyl transferase component Bud32/TM2 domain-containing membrane protein YozV
MLAEPALVPFSLLILALLLCFGLVAVSVVGLIIYFVRRSDQKKNGLPPVPPPPAIAKTEVMPRKCPQCGATLQPDAPEGLCPACLLQRGFATEAGAPSGQSSFVPPPISELAKLFPQLEILECLGRGGMGAVYKARQPRLDRFVALKILAPEKQNDVQFAERFEREARALARLNHPNIVTVFDFGEVSGQFYLLMEFVDGLTLRQLLQTGKMAPAEALNIVPKICEALQFAHEQGIVHRDIKPENILLDKQGRVKIADFGIAKIAGLESKDFSLTGAKDVMGTPHYMAPEQIEKPLTVDHRADIYSLGVVFYEMLTGELPLGKFAPPSSKVQVDVRLDEVVLHALEKEPARRYQHASQVKTAVETITGTPLQFAAAQSASGSTAPPNLSIAMGANASDKIILPAFLLAFFFGFTGAHRFYVGKIGTAIVQLCTLGGFGIWSTIDWILLVCKAFTDGQGRTITNWIHPGPSVAKPVVQMPAGGSPIAPLANAKTSGNPSGMIVAPAVALMIAGLWKISWATFGWLDLITGGKFFGNHIGNLLLTSYVFLSGLLILFGGYQMLKRGSYGWAVAAGIFSVMACSLISPPIGIWALIVLARDDVKSAFGASNSAAPMAPQPDRFWQRFAVVIACVILIPIAVAILGLLAAIAIPNFVGARTRAKEISAQELQQAGIREEGGEFRKDSSQTFPLNADGRFSIGNVNGRIEIHGWSSNAVALHTSIHGRTGEAVNAVKINVHSDPGQAEINTDLGDHLDSGWNWLRMLGRDKATVDYTVQVPQQAQLAGVSSVNGRIKIDGVAGDINASTVNGEMQIKNAAHDLKLNTVNGTITADMDSLGSGQTVKLDAVNGEISLGVPANADANFSVTTVNGSISSEFPSLQAKKEWPVGNNLKGSLGNGDGSVKVNAVNGTIKFLKNRAPSAKAVERPDSTQLFYEWRGTGWVAVTNHDFRTDSPAVSAAKKWLPLIDAGDYAESWQGTATFVQGKKTEADWSNYLNTNRTALGKLISRQLVASIPLTSSNGVPTSPAVSGPITASPPIAPDGPYVFMRFQSSFAEKKDAKEDVTFSLEKDGQWRAVSYFIK